MMKKGDKVKLSFKPDVIGTIKDVFTDDHWSLSYTDQAKYLVVYDGQNLIPPKDWHYEHELIKIEVANYSFPLKCECGAESAGYETHSDYCPKKN
jgi:hypothetical protein